MCKNISKNIGKNAIGKYSQKLFDSAKQSTTDPCKNSSKRKIRKTMEVSSDSICKIIAEKLHETLNVLPQGKQRV